VSSSGLNAGMETSVLLINGIVNDTLLNSGPDIYKTLLQIVHMMLFVS